MKAIKKLLKFIKWTLIVLVVLVLAIVLTIPLWIGPVVTTGANMAVPGVVKTDFHLGQFGLNPYRGTLNVGDMQLANPTNYSKENCVELGKFYVRVDPLTVASKKIHIEEITLDGLLVATTVGAGNFLQIAENASGEDKSIEKSRELRGDEAAQRREEEFKEDMKAEAQVSNKEAPKVVIDRITLKNITVKIGAVSIPLPTISMEGIGADKPEGTTMLEAANEIYNKILENASALGAALGELGTAALDAAGEAANAAVNAASDAANAAGEAASAAVDAVTDAVKDVNLGGAAEAVTGGAGAATEAVTSGASNIIKGAGNLGSSAAGAIGSGAGSVLEGAGNVGGAAVDAVGAGAGKAMDAVKGIFGK